MGRRRNNPDKICKCCGIKIFNKCRNAIYCKECVKDIYIIKSKLNQKAYWLRKKYPEYNIKIKIDIKKKVKYVKNE